MSSFLALYAAQVSRAKAARVPLLFVATMPVLVLVVAADASQVADSLGQLTWADFEVVSSD